MKKSLVFSVAVLFIIAGIFLPVQGRAQTAGSNFGITPGMSNDQIIQILVQIVQSLMQQIQTILAQRNSTPPVTLPPMPTPPPISPTPTTPVSTSTNPYISYVQAYAEGVNIIHIGEQARVFGNNFSTNSTVTVFIGKYPVSGQVNSDGSQVTFMVPAGLSTGNYNLYVADHVFQTNSVYVNVLSPTSNPTQSPLTILSPNGGEVWTTNSTQQIRWNTSKSSYIDNYIEIDLVGSNGVVLATIATNVPNTGTYSWFIPPDFKWSGGNYKILISSLPAGRDSVQDFSDNYFTITPTQPPMMISWTGGSNKVQIGLVDSRFESGTILGWITTNGITAGSLTWDKKTVSDLMGSVNWQVSSLSQGPFRILGVSADSMGNFCFGSGGGGCNYVLSNSFDISNAPSVIALPAFLSYTTPAPTISPSVTVLSPNGGETFNPGQQISIRYTTNNFPRAVNVQFQLNKGAVYPNGPYNPVSNIVGAYVPATGSYTYVLPSNLVPGNDYSLLIMSDYPTTETSGSNSGHSNNFTVVSPASSAPQVGDVNGDGVINCTDYTMIMNATAGLITLNADQAKRADVDGNGYVQAADAATLMRINGLTCPTSELPSTPSSDAYASLLNSMQSILSGLSSAVQSLK